MSSEALFLAFLGVVTWILLRATSNEPRRADVDVSKYAQWTPKDTGVYLREQGYTDEHIAAFVRAMKKHSLRGNILPSLTEADLQHQLEIDNALTRKQMVADFQLLPAAAHAQRAQDSPRRSHADPYQKDLKPNGTSIIGGLFSFIGSIIFSVFWVVLHGGLLLFLLLLFGRLKQNSNQLKPLSEALDFGRFGWPSHAEERMNYNLQYFAPNYVLSLIMATVLSLLTIVSPAKIGVVLTLCTLHMFLRKRPPAAVLQGMSVWNLLFNRRRHN
ncbi:hypothetical protein PTSG_02212 [Salpingoeca rosetta]|uniref:PRA1 family protein n=1 Tax=Salpingoeca rosetta (strain ATCC 50818 / BSB-021) TaxID=946362 RepID=F2U1J2_SALR5|nr:uncharacterized protein PTSG_02212 [Salpingoeca rosetta]EGD81494.1 hypothetical protein PTSG_02212 [Salpingoeca rosetta]|eukprot:XP_004996698.1 hypothetical protein PTSG_02212 [Salpingoeca rosetta]